MCSILGPLLRFKIDEARLSVSLLTRPIFLATFNSASCIIIADMPLFALPLAETSNASNSRSHLAPNHREKRKRLRTRHSSSDEDSTSEDDDTFLAPVTNPLSLTPDEIAQYQLAGLNLNEEAPRVKDFPHRGLASRSVEKEEKRSRKGKEKETGDVEKTKDTSLRKKSTPALRTQHLGVLTAILQKCLMDGDIPRATRAFAMLIRTQFGGHAVDIRSSGYWGIGAELLVRGMQQTDPIPLAGAENSDGEDQRVKIPQSKRWGTKDGLAKAKDYYEWLILEYPYKRQWDSAVTAIDFWPAMLGCEIYGIQLEQKEELQKIENEEERARDDSDGDSDDEEASQEDVDDDFTASQNRKARRRFRLRQKHWQQREETRRTALKASESLAARMDEMMNPPPFSDNHALLRLRGMVALYIGDLSVCALPIDEDDENDEQVPTRSLRSGRGRDPESRAMYRQRLTDHELGKVKREEEIDRASKLFEKIRQDGGWLQGNLGISTEYEEEEKSDDGF